MIDETPQASDPTADAAVAGIADSGAAGGETGRPPRDPATDGPTWMPGTHYLEQIAVDWRDVRTIDVVAVDFDTSEQEGGILAKVRQLIETHVALDALAEPIADALPSDEHGAFRGEVIPPAEGGGTAEIRVTHEHPSTDAEDARAGTSG